MVFELMGARNWVSFSGPVFIHFYLTRRVGVGAVDFQIKGVDGYVLGRSDKRKMDCPTV